MSRWENAIFLWLGKGTFFFFNFEALFTRLTPQEFGICILELWIKKEATWGPWGFGRKIKREGKDVWPGFRTGY